MNGLSFNLLALTGSGNSNGGAPFFVLAGPSTSLTALQSNIDYISSGSTINGNTVAVTPLPAAGPITIAFNQAINPATVHASLINEDGTNSATTLAPTVSVNELSLAPSAALTAGARYNLDLSVDAANRTGNTSAGTRTYSVVAPFFVQPSAAAVSIVSVVNDPLYSGAAPTANTGHVIVTFSEPIGFGRASTSNIPCAGFYEAQLNATPTLGFGGEWTPAGQSWPLQCYGTGAFEGTFNGVSYTNSGNNSGIDPTQLTDIEYNGTYVNNVNRLTRTGFYSRWTMQYTSGAAASATNNSICAAGLTAGSAAGQCVPPVTGTKVHLVFSLANAGLQVTRVNGDPLPDTLTFTLP